MDAWIGLRKRVAPFRQRWEDGLAQTAHPLHALARRALDAFDRAEAPPADAELHGAMQALLGPQTDFQKDEPRFADFTALQIALGGLTFALQATVAASAFGFRYASHIGIYGKDFVWIVPRANLQLDVQPWIAVRRAVAEASPDARASASRWAVERSTKQDIERDVRFALAWVLPSVADLWTEEDARYGLVCDEAPGPIYVLASMRAIELPVRVGWALDGLPTYAQINEHLGPRSVAVLRGSLGAEGVAALVASCGGVDAVRALAESADSEKEVLPAFRAMALAEGGDAKEAHAAVIAGVLAEEPTRKARRSRRRQRPLLRPILEATLRSISATSRSADSSDAADLDLPDVIRTPPWTRASTKSTKTSKAKSSASNAARPAQTVAFEERLDWGKRDPSTLYQVQAEFTQRTLANAEGDGTFFTHSFSWADDATARRLLHEIPAARWYGGVDDLEGLLARFGLDALAPVLAYVKRQPDRFPALAAVDSPRVAVLAAHLFANSKKMKNAAADWLSERSRAAAVGLVAALATEKGKQREAIDAALEFVRGIHSDIVAEVVDAAGAGAIVESAHAASVGKAIKQPKLPSFVQVELLARPALANGKGNLSLEATKTLVCLVALSDRREPSPWCESVRAAFEPASLDAFAWSLFVDWLAAGGPPKFPAGLDVLGLFGSDDTLRCLADAAREWAPGGVPIRAQAAVDVLAIAPGMAGIEGIHRLTQVQSRALSRHAEQVLAAVAKQRGMTSEDLVDQLIPDLGFESDGTLTLEVGSRTFSVCFDDAMQPYVVDAPSGGTKLADLPAARDGDDDGLAAVARWKQIKKEAKAIFKEQTRRLELAVAIERRLPLDRFEGTFAKHPLLQHLVRRFVWVAENPGRGFAIAFRLAEDGSYADASDQSVSLPADVVVGLLHPLRCASSDVAMWAQRLADYRIIQPFDQLARSTHALVPSESSSSSLDRATGWRVPTGSILKMSRLGWTRGDSGQGGRVDHWEKRTQRGIVARLLLEPGIYLGSPLDDPEQTLGPLIFVANDAQREPMALRDVDPLVLSELLRDLETLRPT